MDNTHALSLVAASSQYASIADASQTGLDLATTGTLECWINPTSLPTSGNTATLIAKDSTGQRAYHLGLRNESGTQRIDVSVLDSGANQDYYSYVVTLPTGVWTHIGLTINTANAGATTFELFINGISVGNMAINSGNTTANISTIFNGTAPFTIGGRSTSSSYYNGLIDEVRVWNDVRTATEIRDNMFEDVTGQTGLQGYWKLNNDYTDSSGNGNTLTASGSPTFSTTVPFPEYTDIVPLELASTTLFTDADIVAYYKLEDTSDSVGSNTLTNNNSVTFSAGKFSNAANFGNPNTNSYLSRTDNLGLNTQQAGILSFSGWLNLSALPASGDGEQVFFFDSSTQSQLGLFYYNDSGTYKLRLRHYNSTGGGQNFDWTVALTTGTWYHVAVIKNGTSLNLYLNGVVYDTKTLTEADGNGGASSRFALGYQSTNNVSPLSGYLDDVAFFDRVLTATEIFQIYTGSGWSTAYTQVLTDSLTLAESVTRATTKPFLETFSLTDTLTRISTLQRNLSDSVSISDIVVSGYVTLKEVTDSFSLSERLTRRLNGEILRWEKIGKVVQTTWTKLTKGTIESG